MNWFFFALLSPALHGISNHIDKYLLNKYFKGGDTSTLIIFSSIFGIFLLPFIFLFQPGVLSIGKENGLLLIVDGIIFALYLIPYFYALNRDEASVVVPLFQVTPVFGFILAYLVLGENLTSNQIMASVLIITGAIILSLNLESKIPKFKKNIFIAMFISSFLAALGGLLFKFVAIKESFWISTFWGYLGYAIVGVVLLTFFRSYRSRFIELFKTNSAKILGINSLNEILYIAGALGLAYASLLAPLSIVLVVDSLQPFFVFVYGIILTFLLPKIVKEKLTSKALVQKILSISIIFLGVYLLNR